MHCVRPQVNAAVYVAYGEELARVGPSPFAVRGCSGHRTVHAGRPLQLSRRMPQSADRIRAQTPVAFLDFATSHATQPVQNLWINRAFPVDVSTAPCFFALMPEKVRSTGTMSAPSYGASLVSIRAKRRIALVSNSPSALITVTAAVHRFEESIGGRPYVIEVAAVEEDRWRAYIVRLPGVPTALMPFYGSTPVEAAHLLSQWLTRAHERAANGAMPARRYLGSNTSMGIDRSADDPPRGRHEL